MEIHDHIDGASVVVVVQSLVDRHPQGLQNLYAGQGLELAHGAGFLFGGVSTTGSFFVGLGATVAVCSPCRRIFFWGGFDLVIFFPLPCRVSSWRQ